MLLLPPATAGAQPAASPPAVDDGERHYSIPSQPVAAALARFARLSGVNIIYPQSLAGNRRSAAVEGVLPAPVALRQLLEGTGLTARFTGPASAIIFAKDGSPAPPPTAGKAEGRPALRLDMAEVRAPRLVGKPDRSLFSHYALRVQREIFERLKQDGAYEGRRFRIEIAVTVEPDGRIGGLAFLRPSAEPDWDERVRTLLLGQTISLPPPDGLVETMRFEVEADSLSDRPARGGALQNGPGQNGPGLRR
ncbi:TonB C-terminal domain-containing protein [Sandaracinobacter sp. RS1-74]|uniref:TonB C-terminal domain-containing protein n=1 Tax=Sandaracinobacteroides sayramensis TaxID=2913411 RepID=UPI001EDBD44F|nr:TonB C-terminal domain-containing protein [Sandaracinobacteroides sayramensis]MCG2842824.1 TonB C-terminal domain-containing protein [Sandaracinobacteroides sayramensis]